MDNFNYMFWDGMERAATLVTYCVFAAVIGKSLAEERRKVKATLGREPSLEDWQYLYELKQEKRNSEDARLWESDREKLRRLVFGEEV